MLPDWVSNPGPLTYESGALPIALRGPAEWLVRFGYGAKLPEGRKIDAGLRHPLTGKLWQPSSKWVSDRICNDVVVVVLLFYVHGKHLRSCQDGQLT